MGRFIRIRGLALKEKKGARFFYWGFFIPFSESSSPGESHPQALPEPDVNLSIHPALIVQPPGASPFANGQIDSAPFEQCVPILKRLLLTH
jgi:hypothetical protein